MCCLEPVAACVFLRSTSNHLNGDLSSGLWYVDEGSDRPAWLASTETELLGDLKKVIAIPFTCASDLWKQARVRATVMNASRCVIL